MMMAREHARPELAAVHWQEQGACKTRPDLNWFPERGERMVEQREVCAGCPVRLDCLAEALDLGAHADFGIWGGTSERQRRAMRRQRAIADGRVRGPAECGTRSGYMRHRRLNEQTCPACRAANNAYTAKQQIAYRNQTR